MVLFKLKRCAAKLDSAMYNGDDSDSLRKSTAKEQKVPLILDEMSSKEVKVTISGKDIIV